MTRLEPVRWERPGPTATAETKAVYVHAPFCARRCFYCDFAVHVARAPDPDPWLSALRGEWAALQEEGVFAPRAPLQSLYVGGGTPSLLGPEAMPGLAGIFGRDLLGGPGLEWTAEANPESFTPEVASAWREAGVNRVSLGVQSFQPEPLRWMGRLHGPEGSRQAVARAREAGFETLSIDLIFALPGRVARSWEADLRAALELEVPHVSLYGLTAEPATPLGRAVREGRERLPDQEAYGDAYLTAARTLETEGYEHYEVSNFALPGHASVHNRAYWDGRPYLGMGNSAHSYRHPVRRWNLRDWDAYRREILAGGLPEAERERLSPESARLERIWLGLRTRRGIHRPSLPRAAWELSGQWVEAGWAEDDPKVVRLTAEGWLLLDRLAVDLDDRLARAEG